MRKPARRHPTTALKARRLNTVYVLAGVLIIVLPLLAVMQYRLLESMAESRLDQTLYAYRTSAQQAAKLIDTEMQTICRAVQYSAAPYDLTQLPQMFDDVQKQLAHKLPPQLQGVVRGYYWMEAGVDRPVVVQRFLSCSQPLSDVNEKRWRPLLDYLATFTLPPRLNKGRMPVGVFGDELVALVPLIDDTTPDNKLGWAVLELDRDLLVGNLINPVARERVCDENGENLAVGVMDHKSGTLLSSTDPALVGRCFARVETTVKVFMFHDRLIFLNTDKMAKKKAMKETAPMAVPAPAQYINPGEWTLMVRHPDGSLASHIAELHRRNMLVGSAVLLVLAAAGILLVVIARRAQRLTQMQQEFIGGVSHELRTPLAVISAAGENLADDVIRDQADVRQYGQLIQKEGRRLQNMVEGVLQFTRLQTRHGAVGNVPVDVADVVNEAVSRLRQQLQGDGFTVEVDLGTEASLVCGDQQALLAAVTNLVSNARKYGRRGKWIRITVATAGGEVTVGVQDRGPGVAAGERRRIIEPFYRADAARDAQIAGAGLGLSIVAEIARHHGGRVEQQNTEPVGSLFQIILPMAENTNCDRSAP